ncbi:substrate-binding domain-containing protein [Yoonia sp. R2331]|uniref:substrate-binding domain-containing protein n=1 Tax=Yoonia sp. R2331 TaxID=3237238 RepID=UPI0034E47981
MNLKELSSQLGLSQTTVSRALNGYPEVSESTRQRVMAAAEQFHYAPSTRAKGLATGKALAIGHVIPTTKSHEMVNPIFADFIAGAGEEYARQGYEMILSVLNNDEDEHRVYQNLKSRRAVDGVVVHAPKMDDPRIPLLKDLDLPFVVHGRASGVSLPYSWLDVNNRSAFHRATGFLYDLGHRRMALLNGNEQMDFAMRRRRGFVDALTDRGITADPTLMHADEMTEDFGYLTTREMLAQDAPPTAILTSSMIIALGVRRAVEESGLKMGRDVSIITHDDRLSYLRNGGDVPIFTATRSSVRDAGRQLAAMLLQIIAEPDKNPMQTLLEAELTVGQSTGPAPR